MKILIADDELHIRRSLSKSLQSFGYNEILEVENGKEALEASFNFQPDIIIADIRMPIMDGIELLSMLREAGSNVIYIILSGYDHFEYAQKAVTLGALSYLLKPIKDEELKTCIDTAKKIIDLNEDHANENSQMKIKVKEADYLFARYFFTELVSGNITDQTYIEKNIIQLNIDIKWESFMVVISNIDLYETMAEKSSILDSDLLKFCIGNVFAEIFNQVDLFVIPFNIYNGEGFILNFNLENPYIENEKLEALCIRVQNTIFQISKSPISFGIGHIVTEIYNISKSYDSAQKALLQKLVKSDDKIFFIDNSTPLQNAPLVSFRKEQSLLSFFEKGDNNSAYQLFEDLYSKYFTTGNFDIDGLKRLNYQLIILLYKILNRYNINSEEVLGDEFCLYTEVNNLIGIDSTLSFFKEKIQICFDSISSEKLNSTISIMDKAKKYIEDNYSHGISLDSVAEHVHFSPEHFSREFKKEFKENFINYLTEYRILKAKELLSNSNKKSFEISSMVGFNNIKYFSKLFKKKTGFSPSEYRSRFYKN